MKALCIDFYIYHAFCVLTRRYKFDDYIRYFDRGSQYTRDVLSGAGVKQGLIGVNRYCYDNTRTESFFQH